MKKNYLTMLLSKILGKVKLIGKNANVLWIQTNRCIVGVIYRTGYSIK